MLKRSLLSPFVLLALFASVSCKDEKPVAPATQAPPAVAEVKKPVQKTAGVLHFNGIPEQGLTLKEVIIVSSLSEKARKQMGLQRKLFEAKLTGVDPMGELDETRDLSLTDTARLNAKFAAQASSLPAVLMIDEDLGNNHLRKMQSDAGLHREYQHLFASVNVTNVARAIQFIDDKIQADGTKQVAASETDNTFQRRQAEINLEWLRQVHTHLKTLLPLGEELIQAKQAYADRKLNTSEALKTWDAFSAAYSAALMAEVFSNSLGAAEVAADNSFEVIGQGQLVVRFEYGLRSTYFLPEDASETRVKVSDLRQFE